MNIYKSAAIILCLLLNSSAVFSEMYKWVDQEGNISYSDTPPYKGAESLDAPAITTMPATAVAKKKPAKANQPEEEKTTKYSYLRITSPENDATIQNNEGNFSISITVKPSLDTKNGHYFSLSMDGKVVQDKLSGNSANMSNIDRGSHKISVSIKDKNGKTLRKSKAVTVHLHRRSILNRPAR